MQQDDLDKAYNDLIEYENEIIKENEKLITSFGINAIEDYKDLIYDCDVTDKITVVDSPDGMKQDEDCGIFRDIHVKQWTTNMEGDSYAGFIYANVHDKWIKVPFSC